MYAEFGEKETEAEEPAEAGRVVVVVGGIVVVVVDDGIVVVVVEGGIVVVVVVVAPETSQCLRTPGTGSLPNVVLLQAIGPVRVFVT